MTKLTYTAALNTVLTNDNIEPEVREKLEALVASLAKRNAKAGTRKPTKTQRENVAVKENIVAYINAIEDGVQAKTVAEALEISTQKASALMNQLVTDGILAKTEGPKRVTLFTMADRVADAE